jgi:HTH-type transcriptional regulator / antitoxin HigA
MNIIDQELIEEVLPKFRLGKINTKRTVDMLEYEKLLSITLPHVIRTEAENERYLLVLESLDARPHPSRAEKELTALLTLLIEDFEERHYALKPASPIEHLQELMAAQDLKQKDLVDIFGTASIVSEVLSGKRHLTTEHIRRLSERFHVSPELFL